MEVYLDNAATTKCYAQAAELMTRILCEDYGNPSSLHTKGMEAEKYVRTAAEQIAAALRCKPKEIVFTSGGTESNNLALAGCAQAYQRAGKKILTSPIEHPSVQKTLEHLAEQGFTVTEIPADKNGRIDLDAFRELLDEETILVSVMLVNNETGIIEPVREISEIIRESGAKALLHVDAVQAFGKLPVHVKELGADLLSVSGHKIHGPKGIGFLYIKEKTKIRPIVFGGGQQNDIRSGTIPAPGIVGLGLAAETVCKDLSAQKERLTALKQEFAAGLTSLPDVVINGRTDDTFSPYILNVSFPGIRSEVLLHALEERGIYVSSGSACAAHHPKDASVLQKLGYEKKRVDSAIRFSFSQETTAEELHFTLEVIGELLPVLRRYTRR